MEKLPNKKFFYAAIGLQVLILLGMFAKMYYPILTGKPINLRVMARDPRDLFRGNYVVLDYSLNRLDLATLKTDIQDELKDYKFGDVLYVELAKKDTFYEPVGVWKDIKEVDNQVFLKTIYQSHYQNYYSNYDTISGQYTYDTLGYIVNVKAGIESYFTNEKAAKEIEKLTSWTNRDSLVWTTVKVASNGTARIEAIHFSALKEIPE